MSPEALLEAISRLENNSNTDWEQFRQAALPLSAGFFDPDQMVWDDGYYPSGQRKHGNPDPGWVGLTGTDFKMVLTIFALFLSEEFEHHRDTWLGALERIVQLAEESG